MKDWKFYIYLSLVVIETVALLWYSFLPAMDFMETGFLRLGDFEHLMAYAVYGFLLHRVFRYFFNQKESIVLSVVIGSLVGGVCEGIQLLLPYRIGDVIDWAIDTVGSFVGGLLSSKFKPNSQIN